MSKIDPKKQARAEDDSQPDQEERIRRLEDRVRELGGFSGLQHDDLDPDLKETFLRNVIQMEEAGWNRPGDLLEDGGVEITPPDQVSDEEMPGKLRELVHAMALHNMFLDSTDQQRRRLTTPRGRCRNRPPAFGKASTRRARR